MSDLNKWGFSDEIISQLRDEWRKRDDEIYKSRYAVIHDFSGKYGYVLKGTTLLKKIVTKNNHNWNSELLELNISGGIRQYKINDFENKVWWLQEIDWQPPGQTKLNL